jgi:predicted RNA-binding Zn ribbon-like protein
MGAAPGFQFELTGGSPCLDLANTLEGRPQPRPRELIRAYADLLAWGEQAGLLTHAHARRLRGKARERPREAEAARKRALALREALFSIFSAVADGSGPPPRPLASLNLALPEAMSHLRLTPQGRTFAWGWSKEADWDRPLWPVIRSAGELLTSDARERVRRCAAPDCDWLFLDASRNRSRRWCDMAVCGNRAKARQHYRRQRGRA